MCIDFKKIISEENCMIAKPVLSIIIPVFNLENYLQKCLDSISLQLPDDGSVEIIIINDGSTDESETIIKSYLGSPYIKYLYTQNGGVSRARNLGINNSKGRFITFIDADDFLAENYFSVILHSLKDPGIEILCFGYYEYNGVDKIIKEIPNRPILQKSNDGILKYISFEYQKTIKPYVWNKVYNKELIHKKNLFFLENKYLGEDILFNSDYLQNVSKITCVNIPLYYYYQRNDSVTHKYKENYPLDTINYILDFMEISKKSNFVIPINNLLEFYISRWFGLIYNESFCKEYRHGWRNIKTYLNYDFFSKNKKTISCKDMNFKNRIYFILIRIHASFIIYWILFQKNKMHSKMIK